MSNLHFFLVSQSCVIVTKGEGNIKWDFFELLKDNVNINDGLLSLANCDFINVRESNKSQVFKIKKLALSRKSILKNNISEKNYKNPSIILELNP